MRAYNTEPQVWGGDDPACQHDWQTAANKRGNGGERAYGSSDGTVGRGPAPVSPLHDTCLRCNAWRGELGQEPDVQSYVSHLVEVFAAVKKVLRPDGCLFVNLGDSYASKPVGSFNGGSALLSGRDLSGHGGSGRVDKTAVGAGIKQKDLLLVPDRFRIAMQEDGWWVRSKMPWVKRSCMPESVRDRPVSAVEDVILFTKSGTYFWDAEAVRRTSANTNKQSGRGKPDLSERHGTGGGHTGLTGLAERMICGEASGRHYRTSDMFFDSLGPLLGAADEPEPTPRQGKRTWEERKALGEAMRRGETANRTFGGDGIGDRSDAGPPFPPQGLILDEDGDPLALDVNPAGFEGSHFATFAPKLVRPLILAGTSGKGCCPKCLAPWVRVVERERGPIADTFNPKSVAKVEMGMHSAKTGLAQPGWREHPVASAQTIGWLPSCRCPNPGPPIPCTLLDPFAGSGTALMEADRLGRDAIGIDLQPDYVTMQTERLATDQGPLFADVEVVW